MDENTSTCLNVNQVAANMVRKIIEYPFSIPLAPSVASINEFDASNLVLWADYIFLYLCRDISQWPDCMKKYHPLDAQDDSGSTFLNPQPYKGLMDIERASKLKELNDILRYSQEYMFK